MGKRGPQPTSGEVFQGRLVVAQNNGAPYVHMPTLDVGGRSQRHPLATSRGYVPVLRLVASQMGLGRDRDGRRTPFLTRGQGVRPVDGDAWNWRPSNVMVFRLVDLGRSFRALPVPAPRASRAVKPPKAKLKPRPRSR